MKTYRSASLILLVPCLFALAVPARAQDANSFSAADKAFVAKVSQGGMYEVALGQYAGDHGNAQDIEDSGATEAHDHQLVGDKLKAIVEANNVQFPSALNAEFQARLSSLEALPADKFDAAYLADMKKIHQADGAAFAKESKNGTNPDLKAFAAETYRIVQRHLGELGASVK
jgi:putative membrane protein